MKLGKYPVQNFGRPIIIAELGSNHNGDMKLARKLIDQAKSSGADYVKFQSWTKYSIFSKKVYQENRFLSDDYRKRKDYTLEKIVSEYSMSEQQLADMRRYCVKVKIGFSSTPFSNREVDFLVDELNVDFIKVASMDLNNYGFLNYIARKKKPVVLSTGLSTLAEIDKAVTTIESAGNTKLVILHCVANYPPKDQNVNLNNIDMLRNNYPDYPIGYSDHSLGVAVPLAAVAKGACIIEKHFTLGKNMPGWDHKVSATPDELKDIVAGSKKINQALGSYRRIISKDDLVKIPAFRRSIVAARPIAKGKVIQRADLDVKRPGSGMQPQLMDWVVGKVAKKDIAYDEMIYPKDI